MSLLNMILSLIFLLMTIYVIFNCYSYHRNRKMIAPQEVNVSSDDYDLTSAAICFGLGVGAGLVLSKVTRSLLC